MPRLIVIDSGGTARVVRRLAVVDASGTTRLVRRAFVIDTGGTARQFFSSATVTLDTSYSVNAGPGNTGVSQSALFRLTSTGDVQFTRTNLVGTPINTTQGQWIDPVSEAGNYEARATLISGSANVGTFGVWQALTSTRAWGVAASGSGSTAFAAFTVEIRRVGSSGVDDSTAVDTSAEVG